jgi:hypothetical protein
MYISLIVAEVLQDIQGVSGAASITKASRPAIPQADTKAAIP